MSPTPERARRTRPSLALVLSGLAVVIALTGTAAAAGQLVTIVDTTNGQSARVAGGGLRVNGSVTAREATPTDVVTAIGETFSNSPSFCLTIYQPPAGKGMMLTGYEVAAYSVGAPANLVRIFVSPTSSPCSFAGNSRLIGLTAAGPSPGTVTRQLDAGVAVPEGYAIYANQFLPNGGTGNSATIAVDGYLAPASTVPAPTLKELGPPSNRTGRGATGTGAR